MSGAGTPFWATGQRFDILRRKTKVSCADVLKKTNRLIFEKHDFDIF
jgi:hypothetical protein